MDRQEMYSDEDVLPLSETMDYTNQIVILEPSYLRGEYKKRDCQIVFASGGFGCSPDSRGRAIFCTSMYNGNKERFDRSDILGIANPEKITFTHPGRRMLFDEMLKHSQEISTGAKSNSNMSNYIADKARGIRESEMVEELENIFKTNVLFYKTVMSGNGGVASFLSGEKIEVADTPKLAEKQYENLCYGARNGDTISVKIDMLVLKKEGTKSRRDATDEQIAYIQQNFNGLKELNRIKHIETVKEGNVEVTGQAFLFSRVRVESVVESALEFCVKGHQIDEEGVANTEEFKELHERWQKTAESFQHMHYDIKIGNYGIRDYDYTLSDEELVSQLGKTLEELMSQGKISIFSEYEAEIQCDEVEEMIL